MKSEAQTPTVLNIIRPEKLEETLESFFMV
jgi:hypothetical protein